MPNKSSQSVIDALTTFAAEHRFIRGFTFWDIEKIKSDAGTDVTSHEFEQSCAEKRGCSFLCSSKASGGESFCREDLAIPKEACSMHVGPC